MKNSQEDQEDLEQKNIQTQVNSETLENPDEDGQNNSEEISEENSQEDSSPSSSGDYQDEYNDSGEEQELDESISTKEFRSGERLTFIRVRFPGNSRSFPFMVGERKFAYGQKVIAMSDRGMTVGYINSFPYELSFHQNMLPIRSITKVASKEDIEEQRLHTLEERRAEKACLKLIDDLKLDMNITHVEFTSFGKKAVFYFNAPARVDFRELVKRLVIELKIRIELRQISVRDRTAAIGAIGVCGLQTCCSSFLRNYGNVSIKMAKNQNLALIPSKINGVCGQLKCCLRYEDDVYGEKRKRLPKEGSFIETENGDRGKVLRLQLLVEQFEMLTDQGQRRTYAGAQFDNQRKLPEGWKFPTEFQHIVNETSTVIGLTEKEQEKLEDKTSDRMQSEEERRRASEENLRSLEASPSDSTTQTDKAKEEKLRPILRSELNAQPNRDQNTEQNKDSLNDQEQTDRPKKRRRRKNRGPKKPT